MNIFVWQNVLYFPNDLRDQQTILPNLHSVGSLHNIELRCTETQTSNFRKILKYQISSNTFQREPNFSMRTDGLADRQTYGQAWRSSKSLFAIFRTHKKNLLGRKNIWGSFAPSLPQVTPMNVTVGQRWTPTADSVLCAGRPGQHPVPSLRLRFI
jgi:hypothetical protein